jgi:competence protein ComEC
MTSPLLVVSLAFLAGAACGLGLDSGTWIGLAVGVVAVLGATTAWQGGRRRILLGTLGPLLFIAGMVYADNSGPEQGSIVGVAGTEVVVTGVVVSDPTVAGTGVDIRVAVERVAVGGETASLEGDVLLRTEPGVVFAYGDRIQGTTSLRSLDLGGSGTAFETYLAERGVSATGFLQDAELVTRNAGSPLREAVSDARASVNRGLADSLEDPLAGLAQGIVTGRRDGLERGLREDLNATGISHLVVISGGNVTMLAGLVVAMLAWAIGRRRAIVVAMVAVGAYTVFVGAEAPVVRAAIMATAMLIASALGRRTSPAPAIAFAAAVMVAITPGVLDDLSFQLSFTATAAIALIAGPLRGRAAAWLQLPVDRQSGSVVLSWTLLETGLVTSAAIAATLPLLALHFGSISIVALPVNLLVTPVFPLIFLGSFLTGVIGALDAGAGEAVAFLLAWLPLSWFIEVAKQAATLPFASARIDGFGLIHAAILFAPLVGLALWLQGPRRRGEASASSPRWESLEFPAAFSALGVFVALSVVVWTAVSSGGSETFDVHMLDVGQGDSLLAQTPAGETLLVDGGPDGRVLLRELAAVLPTGNRRIDLVVATHPQLDHIGGLFALFDRYEVGILFVPPTNDETELGGRLRALAENSGTRVVVGEAGMLIQLGEEVLIDVLSPLDGLSDSASGNPNNTSVVLRIRHDAVSFLLTADLEAEAELLLARQPWELHSTVLKVGHHGSATSTTDLLLRRADPALALISVGAGNSFGHPNEGVLERLSEIETLRTDRDGRIVLRSDGVSLRFETER